ncbi:c-type cytochrome [Novosphingobium flavum]|uniref:C-type cytochrome n=1 Tax=Novosphingobium flavum TaxID=1778672 RepID=A0A7X1KLB7_9SPHN|nr:c-type cytochrome [Novosphingobium flavum]
MVAPAKAAAAEVPAVKPAAAKQIAAAPPVAPATFARCTVCHSAEKGAADKLGPNLWGVYGHKAGQGSFSYSPALKAAGLTLDEPTLDKWLENPRALVPDNIMSFPGLKDPAKRQEIIDYLKQLH